MENATKALIIAAAILISIMVISLGIWAFTTANEQTSGAADSANSQVVSTFNAKFESYQGTKDGSEVNALINRVITHNKQDDVHKVTLKGKVNKDDATETINITETTTSNSNRAIPGKDYEITMNYGGQDGRINSINVTAK